MNRSRYIQGHKAKREYSKDILIGDAVRPNERVKEELSLNPSIERLMGLIIRGKQGVVVGFSVSPESSGGPSARVLWDTGKESDVSLKLLEKI